MKPTSASAAAAAALLYQQDMFEDEHGGLAVGMEVDDADPVEVLGADFERQPADSDFFNSFEDDFDDADIA